MSLEAFFTLFNLFLTLVLVVLLTFVLLKSQHNEVAKISLILLMFSRVLLQLLLYLKAFTDFLIHWSMFYRSSFPLQLLNPVLVYFYIVSLCDPEFRFKNIRWYHSIPFLIGVVWYLRGRPYSPENIEIDLYFRTLTSFFVMIPYLWGSFTIVKNVTSLAEDQRSSLVELHLPWLKFLLIICYLTLGLTFLDIIAGPQINFYIFRGIITNLGLIGLIYFGLQSSELFKIRKLSLPAEKDVVPPNPEELKKLSEKLQKILRERKLYLRPQIRLSEVAEEMGIKSYKLSEVISQGLQTNFYNLMNDLRVEHVIQLMRDPTKNHISLLGLSLDSGFNSKSVFNEYFRKKTGTTPSLFRAEISKESELTKPDV